VQPVITSEQIRLIDRLTTERYGILSLTLMENAAAAMARVINTELDGTSAEKRILVLCGKGNNGGDGAAAARLLATAGARVDVVLLAQVADAKGDARTNFDRLRLWIDEQTFREGRAGPASETGALNLFECDSEPAWNHLLESILSNSYDVVIDALFGTGLTRPVEGIHREAIKYLHHLRQARDLDANSFCRIVSVDLPSGLNSDSTELIGDAVYADITVTMTAPKAANVLPPAANCNGRLFVADIGSPDELIGQSESQLFIAESDDAHRWLIKTRYTPDSYKNVHGHALVIAGSRGFTGAAALCGNAAMVAGAGLVTVATPASVQSSVATQVMPELMTTALAETDRGAVSDDALDYVSHLAERVNVIAIGPGLSSEDERTRSFVRGVVNRRRTPIIIDADGLNCLAPWPRDLQGSSDYPIILTPHPGEMLRLLGTTDKSTLNDRVVAARGFATLHRVILVLKGSRSLIAAPDGRVFVNLTGNAGLGTAGAGDTLTGIITGFLAQSYGTLGDRAAALEAVLAALYIGGLAGDLAARELGMRTMVASDIRRHLSAAIRLLDPWGEAPPVSNF
jgi:NAD(P)H-hydrate epimerase